MFWLEEVSGHRLSPEAKGFGHLMRPELTGLGIRSWPEIGWFNSGI
jgi:hypothetical protein